MTNEELADDLTHHCVTNNMPECFCLFCICARRLRAIDKGIEGWASAQIKNPGWMVYDGQYAEGLAKDDVAHGDAIEARPCTLIIHEPQEQSDE